MPRGILETQLTLEQQIQLRDRMLQMPGYRGHKEWIAKEFGVTFSSTGVLTTFARNVVQPYRADRIKRSAEDAKAFGDELRKSGANFSESTIQRIEQLAFEEAISETPDTKRLKTLTDILFTDRGQKHEVDKFRHKLKDDLQVGLDALFEEIKHIPAAVELFEQLQATVKAA